jgi:hypothetical protein
MGIDEIKISIVDFIAIISINNLYKGVLK